MKINGLFWKKVQLLALAVCSLGAVGGLAASETKKPNILFILSDDHGVRDLGCYGNTVIKTPNIDRFATQGMRFTGMFTTAPQCVPSRASLMTGISPVAARITRFSSPLAADVIGLPDLLKREGYYTGACRRGHHLNGPEMGPVAKKMLEEHDLLTFDRRLDFYKPTPKREKTVELISEFFDSVPEGKPWFLWVNFNDPHTPWDADKWAAGIDRKAIKVPGYLPDLPGVRSGLAQYYGSVERMDEEFQWVLNILKERGLEDDTLVVFMGDNGAEVPHGKCTLYDPGLHVPCLVRWPGKVKAGSASDVLLSGEDITPTFLETAGLAVPDHMTGRSFLSLLRGNDYEPRKVIFAERGVHGKTPFTPETLASTYDLGRCVRSERYKLIYNCTPWMKFGWAKNPCWEAMVEARHEGGLDPLFERMYFTTPRPIYEFYDLEKDPWELNNVSGKPEYAEAETELRRALIEKMLVDFDYLPLPAE